MSTTTSPSSTISPSNSMSTTDSHDTQDSHNDSHNKSTVDSHNVQTSTTTNIQNGASDKLVGDLVSLISDQSRTIQGGANFAMNMMAEMSKSFTQMFSSMGSQLFGGLSNRMSGFSVDGFGGSGGSGGLNSLGSGGFGSFRSFGSSRASF